MTRRLTGITLDSLSDLPEPCRSCVYWELDPAAGEQARREASTELEKEAWVSDTLLEWGSCGQLLRVDDVPVGYVLYAPPAYVPRALAFPTSPPSADAVLLTTARVAPEYVGGGLGRILVQAVVRDVVRRGFRAVEAFGRVGGGSDGEGELSCLLPADYLLAVGFKTVRPHPRTPRLRLDVRSTVTWKEDVERALERLRGTIQAPVLSR